MPDGLADGLAPGPNGAASVPPSRAAHRLRLLGLGAAVSGGLAVMWWLSSVFIPLGIGLVVAFLLGPATDRLERRVGSRPRAAALLLLGFFTAALLFVALSLPLVVREARHWAYALSGEGNARVREAARRVDYGAWASPDRRTWEVGALVEEARTGGASEDVLEVLRRALPASPDVPTLAAALGDSDGDGRLEPGYLAQLRRLSKDRESWVGALLGRLDEAGLVGRGTELIERNVTPERLRALVTESGALGSVGDAGLRFVRGVSGALGEVLAFTVSALLVPVYAFFFLLGLPTARERFAVYLPASRRERMLAIAARVNAALAAFVRGRLVVSGLVALATALGWAFLGVRLGFLAGFLVGILGIVPFANLAVLLPVLAISGLEVTLGDHGTAWLIGVVVVYIVGQVLDSVLTPIIVGSGAQIHIVTTIVALLVFGSLLGFVGLLLAIPLAATLKILTEELLLPRLKAWARQS